MPKGAEHEPTRESRNLVRTLVGFGIEQAHIADKLGISQPTLRKHYRQEIDLGTPDMVATVAAALYKKAIKEDGGMPSVTAAIFLLKTRGKYRETSIVEHAGADGAPLPSDGKRVVVLLPDNGRDRPVAALTPPKIVDGEFKVVAGG